MATFTDGLWHSVEVEITSGASDRIGKVNVTIDGKSDVSSRQMTFTSGGDFYIGGNDLALYGSETGYLGCMRYLKVMGESVDVVTADKNFGVINGTCNVQDR